MTVRQQQDSSSETLRRILFFVRESKGNITAAECAEKLNYHPSYIWKILKTELNVNFTELVKEQKLEAARQLLVQTDIPVNEISQRLHYANTQNFIRFFNKYERMTPGRYRKEYRS